MKNGGFYFEIRDLISQFVTSFNDIVIKRFKDNSRTDVDKQIRVRYLYSPKSRVLYDIVNAAKAQTLPVVAVGLKSVSYDKERVFNKNSGFFSQTIVDGRVKQYLTPLPINLSISMSIVARYQTDLEQILSNFLPYCNPYIVISWTVPKEYGLPEVEEIRSTVEWNGSFSLNYPDTLAKTEKALFTADTDFTIRGWLFKPQPSDGAPVYKITNNFYNSMLQDVTADTFSTNAYPLFSKVYANGVEINEDANLTLAFQPYSMHMVANRFDFMDHTTVLLSSDDLSALSRDLSTDVSVVTSTVGDLSGINISDKISIDSKKHATYSLQNLTQAQTCSLVITNEAGVDTFTFNVI